MAKTKYTEFELWEATAKLDSAAEYLLDDAGKRDVFWSEELNEATKLLQNCANKLRREAVKASKCANRRFDGGEAL